jgi:hypothetical protein
VGVVDADAENFLGRQHRRQEFDVAEREIGTHSVHNLAREIEPALA